jgi:acyl-CoA synthetase (AMP-forming)/AMP-acid ligase II
MVMNFWEFRDNHKHNIALIDPQNNFKITYDELFSEADRIAGKIRNETKQLAFLFTENSYPAILIYLSLLRSGHAVLLLESKLNEEIKNEIITQYEPELIFTPTTEINIDYDLDDRFHNYNLFKKRKVIYRTEIYPETAVLLSTSGTTGSPKLVRLSYKNIQANANSIAEYLKLDNSERAVTSLPMSYSYGLSVINSHLLAGGTIVCTERSILFRDFWELFDQNKCTSFAGVPYTYQLLSKTGFNKINLPSLKTMTQAGGRLNENLIKEFNDYALLKGIKFYVMYGQTEATARISYVPAERLSEKIGSMGIPIPGGTIKLFDNEVEIDKENQTGEIVYFGDNVMLGYAETRNCLTKSDEMHGKLRTGDLAVRDQDGYFFIKGRLKRFIKIFGLRINLDEVQKMIENHFELPNACTGKDDLLQILIKSEDRLSEIEVKKYVLNTYKLNFKTVIVKSTDTIPTNSSGKYDYAKINEMFRGNPLQL